MSTKKIRRHTRSRSTDTFAAPVNASSENSDPNLPIPTTPPSSVPPRPRRRLRSPRRTFPLPQESEEVHRRRQESGIKKGRIRFYEVPGTRLRGHQGLPEGPLQERPVRGSGSRDEESRGRVPACGGGRSQTRIEEGEELGGGFREPPLGFGTAAADKSSLRKPRVLADQDWALPGMRQPVMEVEAGEGLSSFVFPPPAKFVPTKDFERDSRLYSSLDGDGERLSWGSRRSSGSQRSRCNETSEHAMYFDAHVLEIQGKLHDIRGYRCLFLIKYDHDQTEIWLLGSVI